MASRYRKTKLTQSTVDRASPEASRYILTDIAIPGFWLVVEPSGRKTFKLRYRVGGGRSGTIREPKIGDATSMKTEKARSIAAEWHAEVAKGGDPSGHRRAQRDAPTMADLFERFLSDHAEKTKKASSAANDRRLIKKKLAPALGRRKVTEITRSDIAQLHNRMSDTPYEANRGLALLSKALNLAELCTLQPEGTNPCRHVKKFAERKRKRFLSPAELARLGEALRIAERDGFLILPPKDGVRATEVRVAVSPWPVAAIRLLVLTGARMSEILGLRWEWIDATNGRAHLPDSKTGEKTIILSPPALAVLAALPRSEDNSHVIQGGKPGTHLVNLKDPWLAIREAAELYDVRIHDLRHSFASVGVAGGASLPIIGALLGHTQPQTTQRYAHLADDPLQAAAASIGERLAAALGDVDGEGNVLESKRQ
jgi:integrase